MRGAVVAIAAACVALAGAVGAQSPTPREGHADVPGVRLWYTDTGGTGQPVVFAHAAGGGCTIAKEHSQFLEQRDAQPG